MHKYRAKATVVDGIKFPSQAEATRYCELKLLLKAGQIRDLVLQPKFELQPKFRKGKVNYQAIHYVADFQYYDVSEGVTVIEDVKGVKTTAYKLKKKLFEYRYPEHTIKEVG